ncbi:hypothetical protein [Campylobacter troglodytis]|uniref:hypothetical protein n=1 Tax=Campylobacter troglodytis TaxID=654363 RepID=UPI001FECD786|nr:hypothetical protein [Campylobacter troglodytis]
MFINQAKEGLIKPCFLNLSFIPLTNKNEANNKASQKIQLTNDDINRGYVNVEFKLPLRFLGEWEGIERTKSRVGSNKFKEILELYFSYGKEMIKLEGDDSRHSSDLNLHIKTSGYEDGEEVEIVLESSDNQNLPFMLKYKTMKQ